MKTLVYHGGTEIIEHPICKIGRPNLDFGQGFYLTDIKKQGQMWAERIGIRRGLLPVLNRYLIDKEAILKEARCLILNAYDKDWLDFIVMCRRGYESSKDYDYIEGGVANDRVIDTVNLYMTGLMDISTALQRLAMHKPNNQICLLNQEITDRYLIYDGTESL